MYFSHSNLASTSVFSHTLQSWFESILQWETRQLDAAGNSDYTQSINLITHININSFSGIGVLFIIAPTLSMVILFSDDIAI